MRLVIVMAVVVVVLLCGPCIVLFACLTLPNSPITELRLAQHYGTQPPCRHAMVQIGQADRGTVIPHAQTASAITIQSLPTGLAGQSAPVDGIDAFALSGMLDALGDRLSAPIQTPITLLILLLPFIFIAGPGAYLILRSHCPQWVRIAIPISVLLIFAALALIRRDVSAAIGVTSVSIIHMAGAGTLQPTETFLGLFAPTNRRYQVLIRYPRQDQPNNASNGMSVVAQKAIMLDPAVIGSPQYLLVRHQTHHLGILASHLVLRSDGTIDGTVTNRMSSILTDIGIATANGAALIGTLKPGQSATVRITTSTTPLPHTYGSLPGIYRLYQTSALGLTGQSDSRSPGPRIGEGAGWHADAGSCGSCPPYYVPAGASLATQHELEILHLAFPDRELPPWPPVIIVGWMHEPIPSLLVNGEVPRRSALDLVIAQPTIFLPQGPVHIPEGTLALHLIAHTGSVIAASEDLSIGNWSSATLALALPHPKGRFVARALHLAITTSPGSLSLSEATVSLYNWPRHVWQTVALRSGTITDAASYISSVGLIRLRLSTAGNGGLFFESVRDQLQIGVDGQVIAPQSH